MLKQLIDMTGSLNVLCSCISLHKPMCLRPAYLHGVAVVNLFQSVIDPGIVVVPLPAQQLVMSPI